jgi:hypothetical protein
LRLLALFARGGLDAGVGVAAEPCVTLPSNPAHLGAPCPAARSDLLNNRPIGQRAVVISAGVVANIIFAFAVLFAQVRATAALSAAAAKSTHEGP